MRVWDISPGYLNRQSLLGEHREIHGLAAVVERDTRGYRNHPETLRWKTCLGALSLRHAQVVAEMRLRGYRHQSPLEVDGPSEWPGRFVDSPGDQFAILREKYVGKEQGRIALPETAADMLAQHRYSVLARDPALLRETQGALGTFGGDGGFHDVALLMVVVLRTRPNEKCVDQVLRSILSSVSQVPEDEMHASPGDLLARLKHMLREADGRESARLFQSTVVPDLDMWLDRQ